MTKKQKKMLIRICVSAGLMILLHFLPEDFPVFPDMPADSVPGRLLRMLL